MVRHNSFIRQAQLKQALLCLCLASVLLTSVFMWSSGFVTTRFYDPVVDLLINEQFLSPRLQAETADEANARHHMMQMNATILGLGRNIGDNMKFVLKQIEYLDKLFGNTQFLFVDGNSTDLTRETFNKWKAGHYHTKRSQLVVVDAPLFESEGHFRGQPMPREGRLAHARNAGLAVLRTWSPSDYVIMIDMDILGWDTNGLLSTFAMKGWDVMCARGIVLNGVYRDTYAFRTTDMDTNHHWSGLDFSNYNLSQEGLPFRREKLQATHMAVRDMMSSSIAVGRHSLIRVNSCFGGLAVYRSAVLRDCDYAYRHTKPPFMLDCEHVLFHQCLHDRNRDIKLFVNPNMKLWYGHGALKMPLSKLLGHASTWLRTKFSSSKRSFRMN